MKGIGLVCVALLVAGCSSTLKLGAQLPPSPQLENDQYIVTGEVDHHVDTGFFSSTIRNQLRVYVNGELVVNGPLHEDESGELLGTYQGKPVLVSCIKPHIFTTVECGVHVDKRKLGVMKFEYRRS